MTCVIAAAKHTDQQVTGCWPLTKAALLIATKQMKLSKKCKRKNQPNRCADNNNNGMPCKLMTKYLLAI